jgi:hypothetical protein
MLPFTGLSAFRSPGGSGAPTAPLARITSERPSIRGRSGAGLGETLDAAPHAWLGTEPDQ